MYFGAYCQPTFSMSPRSFFLILLKVIGLLTIKDLWFAVGKLIENIMYFRGDVYMGIPGLWFVILSAGVVLGILLLIYTLIFRSTIILDKLNLDEGFYDEKFSFNIDYEAAIKIAILAVSIYILVDEIPRFCNYIAQYYSYESSFNEGLKPRLDLFIYSLAKIIVASIMIGNNQFLSRFILSRTEEQGKEEE